jgi:hypothetical protein
MAGITPLPARSIPFSYVIIPDSQPCHTPELPCRCEADTEQRLCAEQVGFRSDWIATRVLFV